MTLPRTAVALLVGTGLSSTALLMSIPFFTLHLQDVTALGAGWIGLIAGTAAFVGAAGGIVGGTVGDRFGRARVMKLGLVGFIATFCALSTAESISAFVIASVSLGISRALFEPSLKAILAEVVDERHRMLAFRWRYLAICGGAIVGPLVGMRLYQWHAAAMFLGTAGVFAGYLAYFSLLRIPARPPSPAEAGASSGALFRILADRRLAAAIAGGTLVFALFGAFESVLPLGLRTSVAEPEALFSTLLVINAVAGIALQVPAQLISRHLRLGTTLVVGTALFAAAYTGFVVAGDVAAIYIAATVVFTAGEALAFPAGEVLIDDCAPPDRKAAYFGAAELRQLGFFVGPAAGGALLDAAGADGMYGAFAGVAGAAALAFIAATRTRSVAFAEEPEVAR